MQVIRSTDSRRTETPNAVMTTPASPTQGGSGHAVWRVDMHPGAVGPVHAFDTEQVWTILDGSARITLDDETTVVAAGDTAVIPADLPRQVHADARRGMTAIVSAPAGARVYRTTPTADAPAGAALGGDRILPDWVR